MKMTTLNLYSLRRNREVIFIETLRELSMRRNWRNPYNLVRRAALLRFLLLEGNRYYDEINKNYHLSIEYEISSSSTRSDAASSNDKNACILVMGKYKFNPEGDSLSISQFLKLPVLKIHNPSLLQHVNEKKKISTTYSVGSLIKLIANGHGGVHIENWENVSGDLMTDHASPFNINENSMLHELIEDISTIVLQSLTPLADAVWSNINTTRPISWEAQAVATLVKEPIKRDEHK